MGASWRKAYKESEVLGVYDTRRNNSRGPRQRKITKDEIIAKQNAEIEYLKAEVELLKKLELHERKVKKDKLVVAQAFMIIEFIVKKLSLNNVIKQICSVAEVSSSGYYNYLKSKNNRKIREKQDEVIKNNVLKAFNYRGYKKGSRSIKMTLKEKFGINYSRKRIQRIMRKFNIIYPIRKPNSYKPIVKATKEYTVVPNLLNRNFKQDIPGKVLLTDITYCPYSNIAYLSTIKDESTNEILPYNLSDRITLDIVINTIHKLMANPNIIKMLLFILIKVAIIQVRHFKNF